MKNNIVLFAQSLNSQDNNTIMHNNSIITDLEKVQEFMLLTSDVSINGKKIIDKNGFKLFIDKGNFTLIIPTRTKDELGRNAPVLLYANIKDDTEVILKNLDNFLQETNRTVDNQILQDILNKLKKKSNILKYTGLLITIAIILYFSFRI